MKELSREELQRIKDIEIGILKEVDLLCRNNNINYSIAFGTLLGGETQRIYSVGRRCRYNDDTKRV